MSEKMRNCKACGQQIAASAKSCPHCGAKIKKVSPFWIVVAVVVLIIAVASSTGDDEPKRVDNNTNTQTEISDTNIDSTEKNNETTKEDKNTFHVGETAELKNVKVSLLGVTESTGSQFNTPKDGNVFVLCEFEIENNSTTEINISSMLSFNAYCDDYACNYSLSALMEKGEKNQLDGTVAAGKKMKGVIGYEVPGDWRELEIRFTPDFWSGKEFVFVATSN